MIARALALASGLSLALAAPAAAQGRSLHVEVTPCPGDWLDEAALDRALRVELAGSELRIAEAGSESLRIERACERPTALTLSLGERLVAVELEDVPEPMRVRALAMAARDLAVDAPRPADAGSDAVPEVSVASSDATERMAVLEDAPNEDPRRVSRAASEGPRQQQRANPSAHLDAPPAWLSLGIAARAHLLGGRVPAPGLSIELAARLLDTPLSFWIALDGLYAFASDALGDVHAGGIDGRAGARLTIAIAPIELSLAVGVLVGYAGTQAITSRTDVRARAFDGALVGLDVAGSVLYEVVPGTRLGFSVGVLGYLLGFEARSEERSLIPFRDAAPWLSLSVAVDLR